MQPINPRKTYSYTDEYIIKLYLEDKKTAITIADETGLTIDEVFNIVNRNGIRKQPKKQPPEPPKSKDMPDVGDKVKVDKKVFLVKEVYRHFFLVEEKSKGGKRNKCVNKGDKWELVN